MTSPPSVLTGSLSAENNCASISDGNGNLLFYSDGMTIYDRTNSVMANGTGIFGGGVPFGNGSANGIRSVTILKRPASQTIYYIVTATSPSAGILGAFYPNHGLWYSVVTVLLR